VVWLISRFDLSLVAFDHEETKHLGGLTAKHRFYRAPDEATATAYIKQIAVNEPFNQVAVEYPGGMICRDQDGIYKP
jgi:hypothetical protein